MLEFIMEEFSEDPAIMNINDLKYFGMTRLRLKPSASRPQNEFSTKCMLQRINKA